MYNHQLDTFIQVADAGSFSKAAEALFISSTAVMKQINLLESSLEVQLFNRTPRGLMLTNAGKSYYQDAKYMIQYAKDARIRAISPAGIDWASSMRCRCGSHSRCPAWRSWPVSGHLWHTGSCTWRLGNRTCLHWSTSAREGFG